jgi:uncharacterized membrane protein
MAQLGGRKNSGKIFLHTVNYTLLTTLAAAAVGAVLFFTVKPGNLTLPADLESVKSAADHGGEWQATTLYDHILNVVPGNIVEPFSSSNVLCIVLIWLILSCLYESFLIPLAVLISVPSGLMGSFLFAWWFGLENNIYLQTGVIMLIGLLAKTAILITEYASERRRKGMGIIESAYAAAQSRFRPIIMTVLTMIFGMLPLMFATGAGANGNSSLGTGVVGGMLVGTLALLFITPVFFIIFQFLQEKIRPAKHEEADAQFMAEQIKSLEERIAKKLEKK